MPEPSEIRVLARPALKNRRQNPYNFRLYSGLRERGVRVDEYSIRNVISRRYDVCHVHWPESTFNASLPEALATTGALLAAMDLLRARGTKLLWTAHNVAAHEQRHPRAEQAFWRAFVRRLDGFFSLSEAGVTAIRERHPKLRARPAFVVPHPHYRGEYEDGVTRSQARARLGLPQTAAIALFFGRVAPYKNVPALIHLFRSLPPGTDGTLPILLVAGKPYDRASERAVLEAAHSDPRIALHLRFVEARDAQLYFRASNLVVLPYREILNSGSAVLALSFDRPVLMPERGAGAELARLVSTRWVQTYDELGAGVLRSALAESVGLPPATDGRHLAALSPATAVSATLAGYRELLT